MIYHVTLRQTRSTSVDKLQHDVDVWLFHKHSMVVPGLSSQTIVAIAGKRLPPWWHRAEPGWPSGLSASLIVFTILSAVAVNVLHCDQPCGLVCPPQLCTFDDLYAGFPVPFLFKSSAGSSALSSTERSVITALSDSYGGCGFWDIPCCGDFCAL